MDESIDQDILTKRGNKYGPMQPMWEAIGGKQWENFIFLAEKFARLGTLPGRQDLAHLAAMNMVEVKTVRALYDSAEQDHTIDGRNYMTIADKVKHGTTE